MVDIRCIVDAKNHLGEGPLWDVKEQRLYWIDSSAAEIGKRMRNAPKWSGNFTSRYAFSRGALTGAAFGASWNYMGPRREGDPLRWSEEWDRFDIFASYRRRFGEYPVSFAFNVKNLLDSTFRVDRDTFAAGREFRFSVTLTLK